MQQMDLRMHERSQAYVMLAEDVIITHLSKHKKISSDNLLFSMPKKRFLFLSKSKKLIA